MTEEAQHHALAEVYGWEHVKPTIYHGKVILIGWHEKFDEDTRNFPSGGDWLSQIPDYHQDRNAIHQLIEGLPPEKQEDVAAELKALIYAPHLTHMQLLKRIMLAEISQICEAVLKAMGKWTEG